MTKNKEEQPLGIKIIGVVLILLGIGIIGQSFVYEIFPSSEFVDESQREAYNIIFGFVVGSVLAVILFIAAVGLFFKKGYAQKLTEIIATLIIIGGILRSITDMTGLVPIVGGIIVIIYFRQKNVKRYFWNIEDDKK